MTLSLGVATWPDDGAKKPELVERADACLYREAAREEPDHARRDLRATPRGEVGDGKAMMAARPRAGLHSLPARVAPAPRAGPA